MSLSRPAADTVTRSIRLVHRAAVWLAVTLVAVKAPFLGWPRMTGPSGWIERVGSLAAISYADVFFTVVAWSLTIGCLVVVRALPPSRPVSWASRAVAFGFVLCAACASFAAVVNVGVFSVLGGFLTYPLLQMVGSVRMVRSSVGAHLTPPVVAALIGVPVVYLAAVWRTGRRVPRRSGPVDPRWAAALGVVAAAWMIAGHAAYGARWATRQERRIAQNPHWVFVASWWQRDARHSVRLPDQFTDGDLADFEPIGLREKPRVDVRRASIRGRTSKPIAVRQPNIILIVLESVAARWTSLSGSGYDTTPTLRAEASRGIVFDNFYAHIGRSSNSLSAMLLSAYPKLGFRDMTDEYPDLPGTSIAGVLRERGYHTGFITPSALTWAGWDRFLERRGFDEVRDERHLACGERISSWGVEDRCMVDDMVRWMEADAMRPFFLMTWTQQTHHPYEPSPGVPLLPLARDRVIDDFGFDRYLNVLHETDRQIARVFDAVRRAGRESDTLVVVTGDHGQAFGYPHESFMQGRSIYEEDVRVPLMIWFPRTYRVPARSAVVGSHVDLAPTIVDLAGVPPAPEWQGRSLFDPRRAPRAYFYVAEDEFMLGVREAGWKYILNVRDGTEELFDLGTDETEQKNVATLHPDICARLRRRLAAWTEANRRQYLHVVPAGTAGVTLRAPGA